MGSRLSRVTLVLALAAAAVLPSCGGGGGGGGASDTFDRQGLLTNLATVLVLPTYQELLTRVQTLKTEVDEFAADSGNATKRAEAQDAWKAAMEMVETAELLQFGPAGSSAEIFGGLDLRVRIYSWPTFSVCLVDDQLVAAPFDPAAATFPGRPINVKGLAAVEYLLFYVAPDAVCGQASDAQRRADYAAGACADVVARVQELVNEWSPAGDNFLAKFSAAAASGVYPSAHAAVNDVFGAMFYLDSVVKDKKLADPAGLDGGAGGALLCESPRATTSKENVLKNLLTFQAIFLGPGAPGALGFDDFLVARGAPGLAVSMAADIVEAIAAVNAIPGTLEAAVLNPTDLALVVAAHDAIRDVTTALKTTFVSALGLTVPATGAGDTD